MSEGVQPIPPPVISKSEFLYGLQCSKLLWHEINASSQMPKPDPVQQALFDQGREVGVLAHRMFPDGIRVSNCETNMAEAMTLSREALHSRKPLFEPSFQAAGGMCRVDILRPAPRDSWDIIEVKSSTTPKKVHYYDLAFQRWVLRLAGVKVRRCFLCLINPDFVRRGEIEPHEFFVLHDLTPKVSKLSRRLDEDVSIMADTIALPQPPDCQIGPYCDAPYACPIHDKCWDWLPEYNVLDLRRGKRKGFDLLDRGITLLKDIPCDFELTDDQEIQKKTAVSGKPHTKRRSIAKFLSRLRYPIHFLDFETFGTAVPLFDGVRPYQQIPFQFSLHILPNATAKPEHIMFLAEGRGDPRLALMPKLRDSIGSKGSIVAYNAGFELDRLKECCEAMPQFGNWVKGLKRRVVDLLDPFRSFAYYHPDQHGSASMKAVLPALTGKGYEGLAIQEGNTASLEFLRVTFGDVTETERQRVRRELGEYCGLDTAGMIEIVEELERIAIRRNIAATIGGA